MKKKSLIDQLNNKNILFDELKNIYKKDKDKIDAHDYQITEPNDLERYQVNIVDANNRIRKLENELEQINNLSDVRRGKIKNDIKELTEYKEKYEEMLDKGKKITLNDINNLINIINSIYSDNGYVTIEGEKIYFQDLINFLQDIIDGKINNLNKKETYKNKISNIEDKIVNNSKKDYKTKDYEKYINNLKDILFGDNTSEIKTEKENPLKIKKEVVC